MNRTYFALFVALLIHFLLAAIIFILDNMIPDTPKQVESKEKKIKISLKEMPKKEKLSGQSREKIQQETIVPPMPKGSQLKKLSKKEPVKYEPKKVAKKPKLNPTSKVVKPKPKPKVEQLPPSKPYIPLQEVKPKKEIAKEIKKEKSLFDILSEDKSHLDKKREAKQEESGSSINSNIKELYGDEFGKLSTGQQKYILDNQEIMRRITQQVLTRVARVNLKNNLNVNRSNVIEFYLHPNGDMTDFRFLQKSGYYTLDDTTKETMEYAYSRYPRPTEKTLIRYNVFYNLARY